ncbi:MAG: energy transducer TonB [Bacteroidota bacterium]
MKNLKLLLLILLLMPNFCAMAQQSSDAGLVYYTEGVRSYRLKQFREADSLFTLSLKMHPHRDTYYNLALTKMQLNDTCGYCDNLMKARDLGDTLAGDMFDAKCTTKNLIYYNTQGRKDTTFSAEMSKYVCKADSELTIVYSITNTKTKVVSTYSELFTDNIAAHEKTAFTTFPPVKQFKFGSLIFTVVEQMPVYPGGDDARIAFLQSQIQYPQRAKEKGIQGTVYVTFVVNMDGSVTDVKILRGIGGGCDEEAVRVVRLMPKWQAGKQDGDPVRVQFNMPIRFSLN